MGLAQKKIDDDFDDIDFTPLKGYKGNNRLKKAGEMIEWTPELILEYKRCANDILYFAEKYYKVVNIDEGLINIPLYPFQKEMILHYQNNKYSLALCSRQIGKCVHKDTKYKVRNKKTGETLYVTAEEFHELTKSK